MRTNHLFSLLVLASLSCGTFGGSSDEEPAPPPPEDPSKPPDIIPGQRLQGIFVSSSRGANGVDGADGSESKPFKTVKEGMLIAQQRKERLLLCAERFDESMELADGVSAYGYFDCATSPWSKVDRRALITAPANDPAFTAKDINASTRIEGIDFAGPDRSKALVGVVASSYGGEVRNAKDITFVDVKFVGGIATNGIDGTAPVANSFTGTPNGGDPTQQAACVTNCNVAPGALSGGAGGVVTCAVGASNPGGAGGDGVTLSSTGVATAASDTRGRPFVGTSQTATGAPGKNGQPGAPKGTTGVAGGLGLNGSNGAWSFTRDGFVPGNGTAGQAGTAGQGGGGGGGGNCWYDSQGGCVTAPGNTNGYRSPRGGGGGAGGCPGLPGTAGKGGGASVGLFVVDSDVKLERVHIAGGSGGAAGTGNLGGNGLQGGLGGSVFIVPPATDGPWGGKGGDGGPGGAAGASGHGAPGPSIGLVFTGKHPSVKDTTLVGGKAGDGAPALTYPSRPEIPAVVGESKSEHTF